LSANGTGFVNIADTASIDNALSVGGTSTFIGNTTMNGSISVVAGASKIAMGADASTATTSINRQNTTASPADVGDLILRVPTDRKAFLVANNTIATAAVANDELITRYSLNQALTPYALTSSLSTYMATSGTLVTGATNQVLGTGASATGSFIVKTANTDRLTINAAGTTSLTNGLSVTGAIAATGKITSAATESTDTGTTVATKNYVDTLVATLQPKFKNVAGVGQIVPIGEPGAGTTGNAGSNTLNKPLSLTLTIPGTSGQVWFWFVQNTNGTNGGGHTFCTLGPGGTVLTGHAGSWYWSGFAIRIT
jgi:hypothetical protein